MANLNPTKASNFGSTLLQSNVNVFWQPVAGATTAGGRLYWVISGGSGADSVVVALLNAAATQVAHATLSISATGVQTFTWIEGTITLAQYAAYYLQVYTSNNRGVTVLNVSTLLLDAFPDPPWTGSEMLGAFCSWIEGGVQYGGSGSPIGQGSGSNTVIAPVEATIVP